MDPRYKLIGFAVWVMVAALATSYLGNLAVLVVVVALLGLARIPFRFALNGVRPALPVLSIVFVFGLLAYRSGPHDVVLFHWGWLHLTTAGLRLGIVSIARFIEMVWLISVFTLSTTTPDTTHALEQVLRPLRLFRFPVHELTLIVAIALRFVPTFAQEAEKLLKAQASRGTDIGTAPWWNVWRRTRHTFPILLPVFLGALRRADSLVEAMDARGYVPGAPRTSYTSYDATWRDGLMLLIAVAMAAVIAVYPFPY